MLRSAISLASTAAFSGSGGVVELRGREHISGSAIGDGLEFTLGLLFVAHAKEQKGQLAGARHWRYRDREPCGIRKRTDSGRAAVRGQLQPRVVRRHVKQPAEQRWPGRCG